jgi:hypothetical protein
LLEFLNFQKMSLILPEDLIYHHYNLFPEHIGVIFQLSEDILIEAIHFPIYFMDILFNNERKVIKTDLGLSSSWLETGSCSSDAIWVTLIRIHALFVILIVIRSFLVMIVSVAGLIAKS